MLFILRSQTGHVDSADPKVNGYAVEGSKSGSQVVYTKSKVFEKTAVSLDKVEDLILTVLIVSVNMTIGLYIQYLPVALINDLIVLILKCNAVI